MGNSKLPPWSHEDMENNVAIVRNSKELAEGACMLAKRLLDLAARLIAEDKVPDSVEPHCHETIS